MDEKKHAAGETAGRTEHREAAIVPSPTATASNASDLEKVSESNVPIDAKRTEVIEGQDVPIRPASPRKSGDGATEKAEGLGKEDDGVAAAATRTRIVDGEEEVEDESTYLSGLPLILLSVGLCLAVFVQALDNAILATAIPKITSDFNSLNDVGWYGSSYLLTTTALQPSFGRIYTYFDVKWTFLVAILIFEIGSILCAAANGSVMLIVGRAIAGVGASALFSGGLTIIAYCVPLRKRPIYLGAISSMFGISSVVGPLLGGVFTDRVSWRWCFWINLPFGAVALVAVFFCFKSPPRKHGKDWTLKQKILEIDLVGAVFLIGAIVCLLLALQWGGSTYPWRHSRIWGCFLGFGLLITVFIIQQFRRGDRGTIPPRVFSKRTVLFACMFSCFMSMALYVHIFYIPFFFQAIKNTSAEGSGIRNIPYLATIIIASIFTGAGVTVWGYYKPFMIASGAVFTVAAGLIYSWQVDTSTGKWVGYQLLAGFGAGAGIQIPFIAVQVVLNNDDMPTGNSLAIFFNSLGGAISISIAQNLFSNGLYRYIPQYAPQVPPVSVIMIGASYLRENIPADRLAGVLLAYMRSLQDAFVLAIVCGGIAFLMSLGVENKSVKGKKLLPGGGA